MIIDNATGEILNGIKVELSGFTPASWDCDGQGSCSDPGTGNGQYSSLSQCQSSCVVPSWDCDGQGNCYDPGTGLGLYSSLTSCESECVNVSLNEIGLNNLLIYPNPAKNTLTIDGDYTSATIYDVFGKVALTTDYQKTIDVLTLSSAIYFIHITTNHTMIIKKITIAK